MLLFSIIILTVDGDRGLEGCLHLQILYVWLLLQALFLFSKVGVNFCEPLTCRLSQISSGIYDSPGLQNA